MADLNLQANAIVSHEAAIRAELAHRKHYKIEQLFPEDGPYRRALYPKHMAFFAAGAQHQERAFIAANRVGKSEAGGVEVTNHLTGVYPAWWEGRRFQSPISAWVAGDTGKTVRDILQGKLLGPPTDIGSGTIPRYRIIDRTPKSGIPNAIDTVWVRHVTGGISTLTFKSYDQRRESFQGTEQHVIWLDEECPEDIYTECLLRTMVLPDEQHLPEDERKGGLIMLTFTPLMGLTPTVLQFMPGGNQVEGEVVAVAA